MLAIFCPRGWLSCRARMELRLSPEGSSISQTWQDPRDEMGLKGPRQCLIFPHTLSCLPRVLNQRLSECHLHPSQSIAPP